jgi:transposase InsO family protein
MHSDIYQIPVNSIDGCLYCASFLDDASRYAHVILLKHKTDIYTAFESLLDSGDISTAALRSDQGREYLARTFRAIGLQNSIRQECTSTYSPEENGVAERFNRTLLEKVRAMLTQSKLEKVSGLLLSCKQHMSIIELRIPPLRMKRHFIVAMLLKQVRTRFPRLQASLK